jgi:enoyl-[acyl-carrier-protein] reductase (NADH)
VRRFIDASLKETVINITIDVHALKYTQQSSLPVCTIKLSKAETMGYCANMMVSGAKRSLTSLDNSLRSILLENGYSPVTVTYKGQELIVDPFVKTAKSQS